MKFEFRQLSPWSDRQIYYFHVDLHGKVRPLRSRLTFETWVIDASQSYILLP